MRLNAASRNAGRWDGRALREQRLHSRARFLSPVPVGIDLGGGKTIQGEIVDISRTGAQLRMKAVLPGRRLAGEFTLAGETVRFSGEVSNVRPVANCVGVRFDGGTDDAARLLAGAVNRAIAPGEDGGRPLATMIRVLTWGDSPKVKVYGALTGHGWRDLLGAVSLFKARVIDLSDAGSIDVGGIALCLMAWERHGVKIERCSRNVRQIMDVARMCEKLCGGECLGRIAI